MIDEQIKLATCQVLCSDECGTGWLVASDTVLTAKHCVVPAIDREHTITLRFGIGEHAQEYSATVLAFSSELDVCLLKLATQLVQAPVELTEELPRPGSRWIAFGYPTVKLQIGHRLQGNISQVLDGLPMGMDLDTTVDANTVLSDYHGFSGAAVVAGNQCIGILRLAVDKTLGALSISRMAEFLRKHEVMPARVDEKPEHSFAERQDFAEEFEATIVAKSGSYLFLEGGPGIGKSTFCREFVPRSNSIEALGIYCIGQRDRGTSPAQRAQPEVLFDWLNMLHSHISTGKPARLSERTYAELIADTQNILTSLAKRCLAKDVVGVIFIDGLNEAAQADNENFKRLIGLLPTTLNKGLLVVLTSTSFDSVAEILGARVTMNTHVVLPRLPYDAESNYCFQELSPECVSSTLVAKLCDRAKGHPLYLRYLIDLINTGTSEDTIDELPTFSGNIQVYYETIWASIISDSQAVQLLGLLARLRWGIPFVEFIDILDEGERAAFITTQSRIRHLLSNSDETTIYHVSFAEFLADKTSGLDVTIHDRLANFFHSHQDTDYSVLNLVYHGIRASTLTQNQTIDNCRQEWVDRCVLLGVEPDLVLKDIDDALEVACSRGAAASVVRLLLLSHRIQFRYDTLFAQSAGLVAASLVALDKKENALQHIYRYGHLLVPIDDVFKIAHHLIRADQMDVAWELLDEADARLLDDIMSEEQLLSDFFARVQCRLHLLVLMQLTGKKPNRMDLPSFIFFSMEQIKANLAQIPETDRHRPRQEIVSNLLASTLLLNGDSYSLDKFPEPFKNTILGSLDVLTSILMSYRAHAARYQLPLDTGHLKDVISAMERVALTELNSSIGLKLGELDTLILLGAPYELVVRLSVAQGDATSGAISLVKSDNVSVNLHIFEEGVACWRLKSFVDRGLEPPPATDWHMINWMAGLEQLTRGLACCDGAARRAALEGDATALEKVWSEIEVRFFEPMRLSLSERVCWDRSYAVPETIFPKLYEQLIELCINCYPAKLDFVITFIDERFGDQCGIYSEGFRAILQAVLSRLSKMELPTSLSGGVIDLALRWKSYVLHNVQNRHELVPELLEMIPILARLQATEEAHLTYQDVLSNSMGPSWYKEEQFSLMLSTLQSFPVDQQLQSTVLPKVEAYLDAASGEITFQRYVRHAKAELVGELCRRGLYADAVRYFQRQVCGTQSELFSQANEGEMDKPSPMESMRYPGGSLDEQAALTELLEQIPPSAGWQICWALLEVYEKGDERHLENWGKAYARLVNQNRHVDGALAAMKSRLVSIFERLPDTESRKRLFESLNSHLEAECVADLADFFDDLDLQAEATPVTSTASTVRPRSEDQSKDNIEAEDENADDSADFVIPGTFGARGVIPQASAVLRQAEIELARRNINAAKKEAVHALQILQGGQWSIWQQPCAEAKLAEDILSGSGSTAESLVKLYAPLLQEERHTQRWVMAEHLIRRMGVLLEPANRTAVLEIVVEHVHQILGAASRSALVRDGSEDPLSLSAEAALYKLLLWLLDHPNWQRRDSAARLALWLMEQREAFLHLVISEASSMSSGSRADILCGALDILSREQPIAFWDRIQPWLDVKVIAQNCRHVGRFAVILRIANRAARTGSATASAAVDYLRQALQASSYSAIPIISTVPHVLANSPLAAQWQALGKLGLATEITAQRVESILREICQPLDVQTAHKLECLLSKGFRESEDFWLSRWQSKLRYALNVALFDAIRVEKIESVEQMLRIYNPESLHRMDRDRFPLALLIDSLSKGRKFRPSSQTHIYLSYQSYVQVGEQSFFLELVPFLTTVGRRVLPRLAGTFTSIQLPNPGAYSLGSICAHVQPMHAYFGSLTPAIPLPEFVEKAGISASKFERSYWRESIDSEGCSIVRSHESCLLTINRENLLLPNGYSLAWVVKINSEVEAVLDQY